MGPSDELRRIAKGLVENCRNGRDFDNLDQFYADHAVSAEAIPMGDQDRIYSGLDAIRAKYEGWMEVMEPVEGGPTGEQAAEGPFYHGDDRFSVIFRAKMKNKMTGEIMDMLETAVYTVKNGKVVREEFFYEV